MNQGFKLRFDQMRENNPSQTGGESSSASEVDHYTQPGYGRNVCMIWPDGKRMFFNYAYLLAASFEPQGEQNTIQLAFSSHTVLMKGYRLEALFMALLDHLPRLISATDARYAQTDDRTESVVTYIQVDSKNGP